VGSTVTRSLNAVELGVLPAPGHQLIVSAHLHETRAIVIENVCIWQERAVTIRLREKRAIVVIGTCEAHLQPCSCLGCQPRWQRNLRRLVQGNSIPSRPSDFPFRPSDFPFRRSGFLFPASVSRCPALACLQSERHLVPADLTARRTRAGRRPWLAADVHMSDLAACARRQP